MADSQTTNYDLVKPEVGASGNTWGGKTNANWDSVDALIAALDFLIAPSKTTPILADKIPIVDTETDPDEVKVITLTQLKALLLAAVSLADNIFEIVDNADGTKKLQFQLSGITTATTRTITIPDLSGTLALLTGAQTFSDKTLTQPIVILKQGAAELPTAEGDIRWDTDDDVLVVGTGAATKVFVAIPASMAAGDVVYASAAKVLSRLAKSTKGKVLRQNTAEDAPSWGGHAPDAVLEDQKAAAAVSGTFNSGAWRTRDLNTEVYDTYGVIALASNQFAMSADGWVEWEAPAYEVGLNQTRLFNVTDAVSVSPGSVERGSAGNTNRSMGAGAVVAGKTYQIQHRCESTNTNDGFGTSGDFGEIEIFTRVKFWIA